MPQLTIDTLNTLLATESPDHPFPIDFDLAWQWAGFTRKDNALRSLKNLFGFTEGTDWIRSAYVDLKTAETQQTEFPLKRGNSKQGVSEMRKNEYFDKYWLSNSTFEHFALSAQTQQGCMVRRHYIECRRQLPLLLADQRRMRDYFERVVYHLERDLDVFYDRQDEIEAAQRRLGIQVYERAPRPQTAITDPGEPYGFEKPI